MKVVEELQNEELLDYKFNNMFIALIPKREGAQALGDFSLVNLLGSLYKVLTKVLTWRMRSVLKGVMSKYQNAFAKGH